MAGLLEDVRNHLRGADLNLAHLEPNAGGPTRDDEHRIMLTNLAAVVRNYRDVGVLRFLLARSIRDRREHESLAATMQMPLRTVELTLPYDELSRRLAIRPDGRTPRRPRSQPRVARPDSSSVPASPTSPSQRSPTCELSARRSPSGWVGYHARMPRPAHRVDEQEGVSGTSPRQAEASQPYSPGDHDGDGTELAGIGLQARVPPHEQR